MQKIFFEAVAGGKNLMSLLCGNYWPGSSRLRCRRSRRNQASLGRAGQQRLPAARLRKGNRSLAPRRENRTVYFRHHGPLLRRATHRRGFPENRRQMYRVASLMPSSPASATTDRLCGAIIFSRTASLRSLEYCMIRSSSAPQGNSIIEKFKSCDNYPDTGGGVTKR